MSRYELKYVIPSDSLARMEVALTSHPLSFSKVYDDRRINNLYFDSAAFKSWIENIEGAPDRSKYRVRWYGTTNKILKPILENKLKQREMGSKLFHDLALSYDARKLAEIVTDVNKASDLEYELMPVTFNSYVRSYYLSFDQRYRLTIDRSLVFGNPSRMTDTMSYHPHPEVIVEVKFEKSGMDDYSDFGNSWPYRQSKFSKFSVGLSTLYQL